VEDISDILFNLASADRLTLLSAINVDKLRLTELAKIINASAQECSRHLTRLGDSGFTKKDSDGLYETTPVGKAVLSILPSVQFILANKQYFLSHDLTFLPRGFIGRTGELSSGEIVNHFSHVLELVKKVISAGQEYVWLIADQPMVVGMSIGPTFSSRNVPMKLIAEPNIERKVVDETKSSLPRSEVATLPEVNIAMAMNETMAGICFPGLNGKIDFSSGFSGADPLFRIWCRDLFEHYWTKSRKISTF